MRKISIQTTLVFFLAGCSTTIPGLTSHTDVPLELKGYQTGMAMEQCPSRLPQASRREGRILHCLLDEKTLGETKVISSGVTALDGRIVMVMFDLDKSGGFSQPGILRALTDKFGPSAPALKPKSHLWSNGPVQLQLDEIAGQVILMDTTGLQTLRAVQAEAGAKDL